jgi:enoyl-CoA hydratase/carnithine racemase
MSSTGDILVERHGHVRLITINRPEKMNSLDFAANDALVAAWREFDADEEARVAVIAGAGDKSFCAGADLKTYTMAFARTPAPEFRRRYTEGPGFGGITRGMEILKPIVAAVNGYAISGGFELALACDVRFCSPNAEFALQDSKWGFHACDGGLIRLPQIVGLGHAMHMILSGERVGAEEAYRIGLVNRVLPQPDLLPHAMDYAQMLARRAPLSHRLAKDVLRRAVGLPLEEALRLESRSFHDLGHTEDLAEGTAAFRERRDANFKGR